jgi:hypothetical protein
MRKLYLFVNGKAFANWYDCLSLTDDGCILGNHICSYMGYMIQDLHDRKDRLETIKAHFKEEQYEIVLLSYEEVKVHPEFNEALKLALHKEQLYEKAGVVVTLEHEGKEIEVSIP